ncbi:hypothetical protein [Tenacibaculum jejuense]|uniref:Uncharacterized protein n=1 Tax=Tenacibaculum jejuense TaxID=584609 RepID=A0A238UEW6_9FLAO|nr:hypothetical protein [Tenacibaculum jejuense]SNR17719.1 protein of unknown function [Tenacibaculum jejuense]
MIDRNVTEWLFYKSIYHRAIGRDKWDDPKWVDLYFPNEEIFCSQIIESGLDDFVKTLIWIFKDQYPIEFASIETCMWGLDKENTPFYEDVNTRKLQDIKPMVVKEDDYGGIQSVAVHFKESQPMVFSWVTSELSDKIDTKKEEDGVMIYTVSDSPINFIEVTKDIITIHIHQDKIVY